MDVKLVTDADAFAALRPAWDSLYGRCERRCLFLTHDWFDAAWQWRRESATLNVLCCWDGQELVGVLPLVRPWDAEQRARRTLEFLTVPDTQACDMIVDRAHLGAVTAALAQELARPGSEWDVLRLRYLPDASLSATALAAALAANDIRSATREVAANLLVPLDSTWEAYYASRGRRLKKAANLVANRLARTGRIAIDWLAPGAGNGVEVEHVVAQITEVSARSWKAATGNSLDNPGPQAFIQRLSRHALARGWLSVWTLRVDEQPRAMEYQVVADGNVYALRSDFDAACEQSSPGSHLSRHLLEQLFGRGLERYLMGPGGNAYKYKWATDSEPVHEMTSYGRTVRGRARALWELALKPPARRLRDRIRALRPSGGESREADETTQ